MVSCVSKSMNCGLRAYISLEKRGLDFRSANANIGILKTPIRKDIFQDKNNGYV